MSLAPSIASAPPIGSVLDGKYRVERPLAEGGMGIVVLATQLQLDRRVAIKFLRMTARHADGVLERFEREAKLAAQIKSEHVVRVHDVGVLPDLGPYMVMEYLEGEHLGSVLGHGPLPVSEAVDYVLQVCDALAEIHSLQIVHRDVKPENLFLAHRPPHPPIVKLIDFGISKATPKRGQTGEWMSEAVGTPAYMSPEQLDGSRVDVRADIWSLGVVLYELVTGCRPFDAPALPDLCTRIVTQPPMPPRQLRPDLPPEIEDAILRCLAKDPAQRIGTVLEVTRLLAPFSPAEKTDRVRRVALASRPRDESRAAKTMLVTRRQNKRTWIPAAFAVCAAFALSGGGLAIYALRADAKPPAPSTGPAIDVPPPAVAESMTAESMTVPPSPEPTAAAVPEAPEPEAIAPSPTAARAKRPPSHAPRAPKPVDPRAGFGERR